MPVEIHELAETLRPKRTGGYRTRGRGWPPRLAGMALGMLWAFGLAWLTVVKGTETDGAPPRKVDFASQVYPIFQRSCVECHGQKKQEGGLRLDAREEWLASGTVSPGAPEESELLRRIELPSGHADVMPAVGEPLSPRRVSVIRRWIAEGANWPAAFAAPQHWAYVPPRRPPLPEVLRGEWCQNPIDHFVLARLEAEGLQPAPPADPEKLVRRVFLDLTGLPPQPQEIEAFLRAPTAARFEQLVDELLARPQFGERWARHWLDLARYADSHGFQRDDLRDVWAYRDWVIQAMNADLPFDQFTVEQVAGDLLPQATPSQKIATGFHRCTPTNVEAGSLPEETRVEQVLDRVNTTGTVWLGTTFECCQCHDHKYDPFTTREYYRLFAFFNNTEQEADRTDPKTPSSIQFQGPALELSDPERDAERARLQQQLATVQQRLAERREQLAAGLPAWSAEWSSRARQKPQTHPLEIVEFRSQGSTDAYQVNEDGSLLLTGGDPPDVDRYRMRAKGHVAQVRAIRLDALRHASLPGGGPGRGDPQRTNFVLNEFTAAVTKVTSTDQAQRATRESRPLEFVRATADFSQTGWDVAGAIDGKPKTGWAIAPQFERPHWAIFQLEHPIDLDDSVELEVELSQQFGRARTIGCLQLSAITGDLQAEAVPTKIVQLLGQPAEAWTDAVRRQLVDYRVEQDADSQALLEEVGRLQQQLEQHKPDTTQVMVELSQPRVTTVFQRGDYLQPGEVVTPGTPDSLHPLPQGPPNRLTLAKWLVSPENPLVARVVVNRWWAEIFGQGIVTTPEDFGIKGEPPSHPELLDWLAVELLESNWSMKSLLRQIVLSASYQQSSHSTPVKLEVDGRNQLLSRGPRFRMDAEMIRDNILSIAGLLDPKPFGPPIRPWQPPGIWKKVGGQAYDYEVSPGSEQHRRGIYVVIKRGSPYPSLVNFDATSRLTCTVDRSRTNTPLQALTLLNDPVYSEAARALAARVTRERSADSLAEQLVYAFRLCTGRQPLPGEQRTLQQLWDDSRAAGRSTTEAWQSVASVLLNLHETITKD